jgi:hypothetical protein
VNPATLTVNGNKAVTASFTQIQYTLIVGVTGSGSTSPDAGSYTYNSGSQVQVAATPASGWVFDHWVLDGSSAGGANSVTVTMNGDHTLNAVFAQPPPPPSSLTLGVYSDSACTTPITDIPWGDLQPGGSTHQTVYIKNTSNVAATLSCTFGNWVPSGAASYITVTWDKEGAPIAPNESVAATFTLTVSPSITGITTFSVQINIIATQA